MKCVEKGCNEKLNKGNIGDLDPFIGERYCILGLCEKHKSKTEFDYIQKGLMSKQLKNQLQSEFWQDIIDRCIHKHGYADVFLVKARGGGFKMTFFKPMEESN